jgi:molybdenum cofactor synthesis domain-containing protein
MVSTLERPRAWVFTLGTEVVSGLVVNTNAAFLGRRLTLMGFTVSGVLSLPDDVDAISTFLNYVLKKYEPELVVTTGGLGPTYDDITLEAVAKALGRPLVLNEEAYAMIREKYLARGYELIPERLKMAYLPEGAKAIPNPVGTAPGALLKVGRTLVVCLPGVPKEMEEMWVNYVEPSIRELSPAKVSEGSFTLIGVPEASLAPILKNYISMYPRVYVKSNPKGFELNAPVLEIYIAASAPTQEEASGILRKVCEELIQKATNIGGRIRDLRC